MNRLCFLPAVLPVLLLLGCTYQAPVVESPSYNLVTSYGEPIPGLWLLYVDATPLQRPIKPDTFECSAHKFPIDAAGPFATSVRQTLDNVVDRIEVVGGPVTSDQLRARGARGLIVVRGEDLRARLEAKQGFWTASMDASATMIASVSVDGLKGRLLGQTVEGQASSTSDAGAMCEGGAKALGKSVSTAMGDAMRRIGEAVSNSDRVRAAPSI